MALRSSKPKLLPGSKTLRKPLLLVVMFLAVVSGTAFVMLSRAAGTSPDLNNDGIVNVFDLSILLTSWGKTGVPADLNADSTVNIFDLSILLSHWGDTVPSPTVTPTWSPTPTSTPAPSGYPDQTNTGYQNAPGYPGHLTDCSNVTIQSNTTYQFCNFPNGLNVGDSSNHPVNVTFIGCRFASNSVGDADVGDYGDNITFDYVTFEPSTVSAGSEPTSPYAAKIANNKGYQYPIDQRFAGALTVDHSDAWGYGNAFQLCCSTQAKPVNISNTWIHNPRDDANGQDHTDGILENYGGPSYMVFNHNSIVGDGNTNALALQGSVNYDHVTITNNYFSGYGYMINSGGHTKSTNMTFTGNVWSTEFQPYWGPFYDDVMYTTKGLGSTWRNNKIHVAAGTTWMNAGNNGLYWWPDDQCASGQGSCNNTMIIGHATDWAGP